VNTVFEEVGNKMVLKLAGDITIGEGDVQLRKNVQSALEKGFLKIVLDMKSVKYIDSSGVGELVASFTTVKNKGGQLILASLNNKILDLLQLTALITVFDICKTTEEALSELDKA
jgi:anti-sigma B factor antagonist